MAGRIRALLTALALFAAPAGAGIAAADSAAALDTGRGRPGFCPDDDGVTVVVDFQELGGSTIVRCAPGGQSSGLSALKNAGFRIAGTTRWGEGFVCRIESRPAPRDESCTDTPPASAYWSYWHAPNDGRWSYSQWGVANRTPARGSFEGWSFSLKRGEGGAPAPRVAPRRPAAPVPAPQRPQQPQQPQQPRPGGGDTNRPPAGRPADGGGTGGNPGAPAESGTRGGGGNGGAPAPGGQANPGTAGTPGGGAPAGPGASTEPTPSASTSAPASAGDRAEHTPGPRDTPTEAPEWTGGEDDGKRVSADAPRTDNVAHTGESSGVPTGTVVVAAAAAVLAGVASFTAWRRKRAAHGDRTP
ncbi:hypothetical protein [Streptomyces sp. I05A-00742]|uniref:hypothetical protein n=1 Tax=Streptomyces sp. I05A-00742 TaxID=2732853 RepID=UPI001BB0DE75|nr:hypothetical protein [Streptomyces sp. I05A-00742]